MTREPWSKPTIVMQVTGLMNKFGRHSAKKPIDEIDGVSVEELMTTYGSPLFIFSERAIRTKFKEIKRVFSTRHPDVRFGWSYKTNYLDSVCSILHQEGALAEVVSEFEYEKARRLGITGGDIYFNGPYKPKESLERAVKEQAHIHIDHFDEMNDLMGMATRLKIEPHVAIRINLDAGIYPSWDRFGFNLESGEAMEAARRIAQHGGMRFDGLHLHLGTFILEPAAYATAVGKLLDFADEIQKRFGIKIEYLDLGGGFASTNTLHSQYMPGEEASPSLNQYAEHICDALSRGFADGRTPGLVLETGRALVDEAGYMATTVIAEKRLPSGLKSLVIDAGVNILFTSFWYKHNVYTTREISGLQEEVIIYGPLCMNIDVVRPSVMLPPVERGESLVLHPVGAYNVTQWMQFIRMRPNVVLVGQDGSHELIREAETIDDIISRERLPERLKKL